MAKCLCGTGLDFNECCEPVFNDLSTAKTAEAVMRSRYTAYVKLNYDHLKNSLHPDHRDDYDEEATKQWAESSLWEKLEIISTEKGSEKDEDGKVEFIATFKVAGESMAHHEMAIFKKVENKWYFESGETVKAVPAKNENKVGRNDPCTCGSGKKYKKCCG